MSSYQKTTIFYSLSLKESTILITVYYLFLFKTCSHFFLKSPSQLYFHPQLPLFTFSLLVASCLQDLYMSMCPSDLSVPFLTALPSPLMFVISYNNFEIITSNINNFLVPELCVCLIVYS